MAKKLFTTNARLKHSIVAGSCLCAMLLLESCYSTTVSVGNMEPGDPAVEANTAHNAHFLGGLINAPKKEDDVYVGDNKDYLIKNYMSVGDAIVSGLTLGIYSPTTTKFYLPYGSEIPEKKDALPPIKFGIRAGLNFPSAPDGSSYEGVETSALTGWKIGAVADMPITQSLYFQPGLYYSQIGYQAQGYYFINNNKEKFNMSYIELALLFSYRFELPKSLVGDNAFTKDLQLQVHAGPYIGYGGYNDTKDFSSDFDDSGLDGGLQFGVGCLLKKHIYIGVSYEVGLSNQANSVVKFDEELQRRNFSIVAGFNF